MNTKNLFYIILLWLVVNAIFPLFLNSNRKVISATNRLVRQRFLNCFETLHAQAVSNDFNNNLPSNNSARYFFRISISQSIWIEIYKIYGYPTFNEGFNKKGLLVNFKKIEAATKKKSLTHRSTRPLNSRSDLNEVAFW